MRVAIAHPDLGIGGAERLIVDAAVGLVERGHQITLYTSHHDPQHAFPETVRGSFPVIVYGDFLPTHIFGRFKIVCATLRALYLAFRVLLSSPHPDIILFDQISAYACIFKLMGVPLVFYCHFPDQLLSQRSSFLKKIYRLPFDILEQATTSMADCILVNSKFTRAVFASTFNWIRTVPEILYPSINLQKYDAAFDRGQSSDLPPESFDSSADIVFLSINRFERKKCVELAIHAFCLLASEKTDVSSKLVIAGGYDPRVRENVEYELELKELALLNGLTRSNFPDMSGQVVFLRSFTEQQRSYLLRRCVAVIYTPQNEHFGIVPVEAMYAGRPVIAVNSGGPLESIIDGKTGFLCDPQPDVFAQRMKEILLNARNVKQMGELGRQHVISRFSFDSFSERLSCILNTTKLAYHPKSASLWLDCLIVIVLISSVVLYTFVKGL